MKLITFFVIVYGIPLLGLALGHLLGFESRLVELQGLFALVLVALKQIEEL
jgi:hypothetical protein